MPITNADIIPAVQAIRELAQERLPLRASLQLRKLARALAEHWQDVEAERQALLDRYAERDAAGERIIENGEIRLRDRSGFEREYQELMSLEFDCPVSLPASLLENVSPRASVVIALGELLVDDLPDG